MEKIHRKAPPTQFYLKDKLHKRKSATKGAWALVALGIIFGLVIIKFATSGGSSDMLTFTMFPNSDDAYQIAKEYVTPTIRQRNLAFAEDRYQFAKKSDSVFVIKSYVTAIDEKGGKVRTNFQITLKYNGGPKMVQENWTMVELNATTD